MRKATRSASLLLMLAVAAAWAQQPTSAKVSNAKVETRATGGDLVRSFQGLVATTNDAAWAGYMVPIIEGQHNMCCWNCTNGNCCNGCTLEGNNRDAAFGTSGQPAVKLEGA